MPVHLLHNGQARASGKIFPPLREFKIELPAGRQVELLFRVKGIKQLQVPVLLRTGEESQQAERLSSGFKGIYIGMMLVLACYNLFIFISTRDRTYLRYVVYILLVFLTQLTFMGIAPMIFWPDSPFLLARASLILTLLTAVAATEFIKRFLHSDRTAPFLHKGIKFFYIAFAGIVVIYFTPIPWFGYQLFDGNSLIGARNEVYNASALQKGAKPRWYEEAPRRLDPQVPDRKPSEIYHFLLPDPGMADYSDKVAKVLYPDDFQRLKDWRRAFARPLESHEISRLQQLSLQIDALWEEHAKWLARDRKVTEDPMAVWADLREELEGRFSDVQVEERTVTAGGAGPSFTTSKWS